VLADRFRTGSLVSPSKFATFSAEKRPVSNRISLSRRVVIALAGSRQVRCVFDVLARWTLENDRRTNLFDTFLIHMFTYFVYDTVWTSSISQLRNFLSAINRCQY